MYGVYFYVDGFLEREGKIVLFSTWIDAWCEGNKDGRHFTVLEAEDIES